MLLLFLCVFALGHVTVAKTLPKDIGVCFRSDPNLDSCLLENARNFIKNFKFEDLGLDSFDPLNIEFMNVDGETDVFKIKMVMKNITLYGHNEMIFNKIKFDPSSLNGEVSFTVPKMRMTCQYYATGRLFVLPLESSADFDGNFTGIETSLSFRLNTIDRKGKNYFTVDKLALKMFVQTGHIKLDSVDSKEQPQVLVIQNFFNENSRLVMDTVNPILVQHGSEFYKHILERYLRKFPADILLPN